jgi:hypothetical protein
VAAPIEAAPLGPGRPPFAPASQPTVMSCRRPCVCSHRLCVPQRTRLRHQDTRNRPGHTELWRTARPAATSCSAIRGSAVTGTAGAAPDTAYVADTNVGIVKYVLSGGTWNLEGTVDVPGVSGLTGSFSGGVATLYSTAPGSLVSLTDSTGDGAMAAGASLTTLATADANEAFRGVAFRPLRHGHPAGQPPRGARYRADSPGCSWGLGCRLVRSTSAPAASDRSIGPDAGDVGVVKLFGEGGRQVLRLGSHNGPLLGR